MSSSGAEVHVLRGRGEETGCFLGIQGTEAQMDDAERQVQEVIERQGTVGTLIISEDVLRSLREKRAEKIQDLEASLGIKIEVPYVGKAPSVTLIGSAEGVKAAKQRISRFAATLDKEIAETVTKEVPVAADLVRRIIGTKGATIKNIKETCKVEIKVPTRKEDEQEDTGEPVMIEVKGAQKGVDEAEQMINDIVGKANKVWTEKSPEEQEEKAERKPKETQRPAAKEQAKKKAVYKESKDDFPDFIGGKKGNDRTLVGHWGSKEKDQVEQGKETVKTKEQAFPKLGGAKKDDKDEDEDKVEEPDEEEEAKEDDEDEEEDAKPEEEDEKKSDDEEKDVDVEEEDAVVPVV